MTVIFNIGRRIPKKWFKRFTKSLGDLITFQEHIWTIIIQSLRKAKKACNSSGKLIFKMEREVVMIHGKKINIYDGDHVPTEKLAKNIRNITTKQIARKNNCYSSTSSAG